MVSINFEADTAVLKEDLAALCDAAPEAALQETFFLMPVRFIIDGTDMLLREVNEPIFISSDEAAL